MSDQPTDISTAIVVSVGADGEPKVMIGNLDMTPFIGRISWHWSKPYAPRLSLDITGMSLVNFKTTTIEGTFRSPVAEVNR